MRRSAVLVLPLLLSGCALPPVVGAVAYLADGVSYVSTGKSVTDNAISTVMDEDCSAWRLLLAESICRGRNDKGKKNAIAVAAATTVHPGEGPNNDTGAPAGSPSIKVAEAPKAATPAVAARLAAIAPAAGPATPAAGREPALATRVLHDAPAATAEPAQAWQVAALRPQPLEAASVTKKPAATKAATQDPATLHAKQMLLKFHKPAEMLAEHPCPGSGSAVFCPLPAIEFNG